MKTGVECEFFLITPDGGAISDAADQQAKPCYDQSALMRRYDVIAEICDAMQALGWQPYQNDHEDANGQFEMNWEYDDALVTADRHAFFKFMVKSIAEKHGLRATFMPKPFANLTGNGCHMHVSLWRDETRTCLTTAKGELGLSQLAYQFIGGVMHSAERCARITNPTVNSYKRINAPRDTVGRHLVAEYHHLRRQQPHPHDPHSRRRPLRAPAARRRGQSVPAAGAVLAAGLDGINERRDPRQAARHQHVHRRPQGQERQEAAAESARRLARLEESADLARALGEGLSASYVKLKHQTGTTTASQLTEWERQTTLDC